MSTKRCLYCYQPLSRDEHDFHEKCSKKFFGTSKHPLLDYSNAQMQELAKEIVIRSIAVTGVQPKLSSLRFTFHELKLRHQRNAVCFWITQMHGTKIIRISDIMFVS